MDDITTSEEDYTPSDQNEQSSEWAQVGRMVEMYTRQRDKLAKSYRKHEAGQADEIDPLRELQAAHDAIRKAMPVARVAPESGSPVTVSVSDLAADYWDQVKQRKNTASTGFGTLNGVLSGGFEGGRLIVILGAPNTGKTTFTHQIAHHVANGGRPVLYVTSEDSPSALFAKSIARIGQVNYTAVLKGLETEKAKINAALSRQRDMLSSERLLYLDATNGVTLDMIREYSREHFAKYTEENGGGPGVIVVDYLQRIARSVKSMSGITADLREVVTMVAERLRALAIELDCTVIAIASQNRTGYTRSGEMGSLASAKESGDVEYTADVIMALNEDKDPKRVPPLQMTPLMLYVDKNRQGQKNKAIPLDFWPDRQQFTDVEAESDRR